MRADLLVDLPEAAGRRFDFEKDNRVHEALGAALLQRSLRRRGEERQFHNTISPTDFDWYLRAV